MNDVSKKPAVTTDEKKIPSAPQEPWRPFDSLRRQVDRLFDDFDRPWHLPFSRHVMDAAPLWQGGPSQMPAVDVVEKESAYEITAELPGLDEKDVEVKLVGNSLVIKGEKRQEHKEEKDGYHLSERSFGSFQRSFALPEGVDRDKIEAKFGKGVLRLSLPKQPGTADSAKNIAVKAE
ncbi:Hsp20/alpha crystallin family protein [Stutzerimonas decontaminans]|jgi:HSP20 family protein|uniref:Hsp20/alpha crystallin family protein n=2 Tax=Stutzerimonas TaxID=2901164 RepID=A0ABX4VS85_9GAMM|nr:Hsp20/alpha crystallin family protein [Stutzerimonas decontaminans]AHY42934.1 molecular chaperone Hsp20 [Stutzerimonas decontaminans]MCQ4244117.1 Hsp20/alpha crystallin family protein [Stutzerimonas decontaminans]MCW8158021.1 Hsp20/alpha crystallin family protein [Stutzerimonas stutzeri]PNF83039.1 Hsp20/alpha crystallin family protein [Stutzerimonas decontaminans]